jgi:formylglycine-generating enzyme required for sulfatase activity
MKTILVLACVLFAGILTLSACSQATLPVNIPTEIISFSSPSPEASATDIPPTNSFTLKPTAEPTEKAEPTLPPLDVFEPAMKAGSTHLYVDGATLIAVPAGKFVMGDRRQDSPEHLVQLEDYWIYSTKVTNRQYALCVEAGECTPPEAAQALTYLNPSRQNDPVVGVNYLQAGSYCSFVKGRLPTEAEWEKAARGPLGDIYPWGNQMPDCDLANYEGCLGTTASVVDTPSGESYYGGLQFAGNAQEWVADWYEAGYDTSSLRENPSGPSKGERRVIRGSSFTSPMNALEPSIRSFALPDESRPDLGFRCLVEEPAYFASFCEAAPVANTSEVSASNGCPEISISQWQYCISNVATTLVTFEGPQGAAIDAGECVPGGTPGQYTCQEPGLVSITASCDLDAMVEMTCPANYSLQGNTCVADGSVGACLAGFRYDGDAGCCVAQPSLNQDQSAAACPVGAYFDEVSGVCLPYSSVTSAFETVSFMDCSSLLGGTETQGASGSGDSPSPTLVTYEPTDSPTEENPPASPTFAPTQAVPTAAPTTPAVVPTPMSPTAAPTTPATPVPATPTPAPPTPVPTEPAPVCEPQDCSDIPDGVWDPDLCCCKMSGDDFCY